MKSAINSCKRTHWFKASMALIGCLLLMTFSPSCQKNESEAESTLKMASISAISTQPQMESSVKDVDGNRYRVIRIGQDYWMAENLRATHFNNGDPIPTTTPATLNITGDTNPYYWSYNDDPKMKAKYGLLYNYSVINDSRGVCPTGWHIPTFVNGNYDTDMEQLLNVQIFGLFKFETVPSASYPILNIRYSITKILAAYPGWPVNPPPLPANYYDEWAPSNASHPEFINVFGFSLLPGGYRDQELLKFKWEGYCGTFWAKEPTIRPDVPPFWVVMFTNGAFNNTNKLSNWFSVTDQDANYGAYIRCKKD